MWQSSNPALAHSNAFEQTINGSAFAMERSNVTTLAGIVNKTVLLSAIALGAGGIGYWLFQGNSGVLWISCIAALIVGLGIAFVLGGKPQLSPIFAPVYAVVEGVFLGAFTALADTILDQRGVGTAFGGVGLQALVITGCVLASMLALYRSGLVQPTDKLKAIIFTATGGIMLAYLLSWVLMLFGASMPLISFPAAVSDTGWMGFLGLGINLFILVIAALWLVIDFGEAEKAAAAAAPKYMEWYCGFALLVTLAWIYYEAVKLVVRLAVLFGNRD